MVGSKTGFAGLLKQHIINCPVIHCIIHQEALCGKSSRQTDVIKVAVKIRNIIRGGNRTLTHGTRDFLAEVDAAYGDLLLHTEIRWLRTENCLQRFFALPKKIVIFLRNEVKSNTTELENQMEEANFLSDLAFLTDMTSHLNELNLKLQGKQHNIANLYGL
ncbi:protein FAM200A-like [Diabrotica undecimpunctata]|uniref:protein FAM200A-like n=1 Tax=Diabrotica undecimpunctata TaxID=50387 RepID=UPI003B636781